MITLFRMIKLWKIKTKWNLFIWMFIDKHALEIINNKEKLEKTIISYFIDTINKNNKGNKDFND